MNKDKSESNSKHAVMLSNYSFILILKNFLRIMRSDHILFMPKTHLARFPGIKKKNAILNFLKLFVRNKSISEISPDEVIGHFWLSNLESARALSKIKMELKAQHSFAVLNNILNDEEVINYFQASLAYDLAYQYLFEFVLVDQKKKYLSIVGITDNRYKLVDSKRISLRSSFKAFINYLFCCAIPIYFIISSLNKGIRKESCIIEPKLSMPVINGINTTEMGYISAAKGIKYSTDDRFIYTNEIEYGDVVHVFNFWKFPSEIKQSYEDNMNQMKIPFLDTERLKIDFKTTKKALEIFFQLLISPISFLRHSNNWYAEKMNTAIPKAIHHVLQKHLEISYLLPQVELIRNDYNPASILRAIISKKAGVKTIGIQHTATPYDCPQICFVNFDYYLLFGNLYKKKFSGFLEDTKIYINGKDFLDPVIRLKQNQNHQDLIKKKFLSTYGAIEKMILIILPGNSPMIRQDMRVSMVDAIKSWEKRANENSGRIILRFRKKIEVQTVKEWKDLYNFSKSNKNFVIDFDEFTTQELMFLSERVIVPHSSYSMTEALALEKESFSFDFSGSAELYFGDYGKGLVMNTERELFDCLSIDNTELSNDIDYNMLSKDLDPYFDGKNTERLQELILSLAIQNTDQKDPIELKQKN